ncbi:MAG: hypothetical protein CML17_07875 [Pusillimonas sp.]|nr:hypothetical protein [Pusillimonas sp.]|tara:strand:+ start:3557 stop:4126 length:570 start_codon:yes stop_codon:yes gene_type:complete
MNIFKMFTGGIGATAKGIARGVATFTGDKVQQEDHLTQEQQAVLAQFASENTQHRTNRTWFDAFVDGLNRLPRPIIALEVIALPHWAVLDPAGFSAAMMALAVTPEWLALIIGQVILLFFGGRMLDKWPRKFDAPNANTVKAVLDAQDKIKKKKRPDEKEYQDAMKNDDPLSEENIREWNRRNNPNFKG